MGAVADDLADIRAFNGRRGPQCSVSTLVETADVAVSDKLLRALADPTIQTKAIARWLVSLGYEMSHWQLQYHRRGDCSCG